MATPPYSYTQTPLPGTPAARTAPLNVAPIRPGTFGRTDFNALAQQRRTEIFVHLKPALELLDKFRHESYEIPVLREMYEKITKEIRVPFCSANGIFNTLGGGKKRRSTYKKNEQSSKSKTFKRDRTWIKKTFMNK